MGRWLEARISFLRRLESYEPAKLDRYSNVSIKLNANENWHIPHEKIRELLYSALSELDPRKYPDESVNMLREAISKNTGIPESCIVACSGSDQAIDLLSQTFLRHGDKALVVSPTFSMYGLRSSLAGARVYKISMNTGFRLPVEELLSNAGEGGIAFVCSPNNPTGNQFERHEIMELVDSFPGLVVLDEAYVEFADFSLSELIKKYSNLAILRTFSKAFGLAGLRLGYILANESWALDFLYKVQYPYPINSIAAIVACKLLDRYDEVKRWIESVKEEREWFIKNLSYINGVSVFDSKANFVMISMKTDSNRVYSRLIESGIATRNLGRVLEFLNCLRITVGTREMNKIFIDNLRSIIDA